MTRKKISISVERIVLQEARKNRHLGVRPLSDLLFKKHNIKISKSAINKILVSSGLHENKGRKRAILLYKSRGIKNCGLILLRCLDYRIGIFDNINKDLKNHFPKLGTEIFKKLVIFSSLASFVGKDPRKIAQEQGFLRLAGIQHLPSSKMDYFSETIRDTRPAVDLSPVKEGLKLVSTIKFNFKNGRHSYTDAKMSTLWYEPCNIGYFFLNQTAAIKIINNMLKDKILFIGYTKSFDYLSKLVFDFLEGVNSGIDTIELLDKDGTFIKELEVESGGFSALVGYCPKILNKGMFFVTKPKKPKRFYWDELGEFFCTYILTRFLQDKEKKGVILNNVLIRKDFSSDPAWGIIIGGNISIKKAKLASHLKKYFYFWPYTERAFFEDLAIIEKSLVSPKKTKDYLAKMVPAKLVFKDILDFSRIAQILSIFFKEMIWGWEPKNKSGDFVVGKDFIKINLKNVPKNARKAFNQIPLYLNKKRVFLA